MIYMPDKKPKRVIMRVDVVPTAIDAHCYLTGMTHAATYTRMVKWIADQDETTQAAVLGLLPESAKIDVVEKFLKKMATRKRGQPQSRSAQ